ncbi:MAG: hypothetical protein NTZ78_12700 [Candidatus Aureabacteria bacterium]|nr:hypothetical protein [Candidatus Auribacterota bacterium]
MKKLITIALGVMLTVGLSGVAVAGSLDSPGAPSAGSGMYTLQNLYDYLTSGAALTVQSSFQEPTTGPTAGTMKTTKQIGDDVKAMFNLCAITAASDVKSGMPFFCTQSGSWGVQTGTGLMQPTPTSTPTSTPTITSTPIPTPTWGQTQCEAAPYNGKWRATQLSIPNDYGCWVYGAMGQTCATTCGALNLACNPDNWNAPCAVCQDITGASGCQATHSAGEAPIVISGYGCYARTDGVNQSCTAFRSDSNRLCVCVLP